MTFVYFLPKQINKGPDPQHRQLQKNVYRYSCLSCDKKWKVWKRVFDFPLQKFGPHSFCNSNNTVLDFAMLFHPT